MNREIQLGRGKLLVKLAKQKNYSSSSSDTEFIDETSVPDSHFEGNNTIFGSTGNGCIQEMGHCYPQNSSSKSYPIVIQEPVTFKCLENERKSVEDKVECWLEQNSTWKEKDKEFVADSNPAKENLTTKSTYDFSSDDTNKDPTFDPESTGKKKWMQRKNRNSSTSSISSTSSTTREASTSICLETNDKRSCINLRSAKTVKKNIFPISETTEKNKEAGITLANQPQTEANDQRTSTPINTKLKKMWKKKKTFCKFCNLDVTNFERHLERNHRDCKEVTELLSFPKKSKERKNIISLLRNAGHFSEFLLGNTRPIYKSDTTSEYLPCSFCKGLYSKKFLARHSRRCLLNNNNKNSKRLKHLSASQTLIACSVDQNATLQKLRIKDEVFSIMRADEIALTAKTDILICHFGENYLKKHKRKQMAIVCSNKMRELARLLIEFRKCKSNGALQLIDMLDPVQFDATVECAKRIGGYDSIAKIYKAPSLSAHIGTSLKQVCEVLIRLLLKEHCSIKCDDKERKIKEVKRFRELIISQWTTEISSMAFKDLNEKRWNKPVILPLTKDILKLKEYITDVANKSVAILREDTNNKKEFKNLVDAALVLTIMYNRKRIGDVQYTLLQTYLQNFSSINQEECLASLTEAEKVLTQHYKRVVTGGKGSRPVVILFPKNIQFYINFMLELRNTTELVSSNNVYLFGYPDTNHWARGDVAIRKFAKNANLQYPNEITSNKLRKQIATVMQILNLNKEESEQFAHFMGHTEKTHNEFYKLPEDVYQTAKISKLLILMDKGVGQKFKGKSLNEIQIDPQREFAESDDDSDNNNENMATTSFNSGTPHDLIVPKDGDTNNLEAVYKEAITTDPETAGTSLYAAEALHNNSNAEDNKKKKATGRTPWTENQTVVVKQHFKTHIKNKVAPKKHECESLLKKYPTLFHNKDWVRIKTYVYNEYRNK